MRNPWKLPEGKGTQNGTDVGLQLARRFERLWCVPSGTSMAPNVCAEMFLRSTVSSPSLDPHGESPVTISKSAVPNDHQSIALVCDSPLRVSGATEQTGPHMVRQDPSSLPRVVFKSYQYVSRMSFSDHVNRHQHRPQQAVESITISNDPPPTPIHTIPSYHSHLHTTPKYSTHNFANWKLRSET